MSSTITIFHIEAVGEFRVVQGGWWHLDGPDGRLTVESEAAAYSALAQDLADVLARPGLTVTTRASLEDAIGEALDRAYAAA